MSKPSVDTKIPLERLMKLQPKHFAFNTNVTVDKIVFNITILPEPFELDRHLPISIDLLNFGIVVLTVHRVYGLAMLTNLILNLMRTYFLQDPNNVQTL